MATTPRKKVTVQYRKLEDFGGAFAGSKLQSVLVSCMSHAISGVTVGDNPACRKFKAEDYGTLILNTYDAQKAYFFGEIVRFDPGAKLQLIETATHQKSYDLKQANAPAGHEPIKGILYFMIVEDHVMIIESDVSTARAEKYLSWLASELTKVLPSGTHVILLADLQLDGAAAQLSNVEKIVIKPQPIMTPSAAIPETEEGIVGSTLHGVAQTDALEVLKAAGMDAAVIQSMVADNTQFEVTVQIRFKGQRRIKSLSKNETSRLLRNLPEDELTLVGPGGRQRNGKIEKLSYVANVLQQDSLLLPSDVLRALNEAYQHFKSNGYID